MLFALGNVDYFFELLISGSLASHRSLWTNSTHFLREHEPGSRALQCAMPGLTVDTCHASVWRLLNVFTHFLHPEVDSRPVSCARVDRHRRRPSSFLSLTGVLTAKCGKQLDQSLRVGDGTVCGTDYWTAFFSLLLLVFLHFRFT